MGMIGLPQQRAVAFSIPTARLGASSPEPKQCNACKIVTGVRGTSGGQNGPERVNDPGQGVTLSRLVLIDDSLVQWGLSAFPILRGAGGAETCRIRPPAAGGEQLSIWLLVPN